MDFKNKHRDFDKKITVFFLYSFSGGGYPENLSRCHVS